MLSEGESSYTSFLAQRLEVNVSCVEKLATRCPKKRIHRRKTWLRQLPPALSGKRKTIQLLVEVANLRLEGAEKAMCVSHDEQQY